MQHETTTMTTVGLVHPRHQDPPLRPGVDSSARSAWRLVRGPSSAPERRDTGPSRYSIQCISMYVPHVWEVVISFVCVDAVIKNQGP